MPFVLARPLYVALALVGSLLRFSSTQAQSPEEAGKLYVSGQLAQLITQGEASLRKDDQQPVLHLFVGRAYADQGHFAEAIPHLEKSCQAPAGTDGIKVWSLGYLGAAYYTTDQVAKAQTMLMECLALNNTPNATKYAQKRLLAYHLTPYYANWKLVETPHLRLHIQAPEQLPDMEQYAVAREQAYQAINQFCGATLSKKLDFYVWQNEAAAQGQLHRELGFAEPALLLVNTLPNQTRGHEIAHVLVYHGLHPTYTTQLINEGVAVYFDQSPTNRLQHARQLTPGRVDVWRLWEHPEEFPSAQVYAIGGALVEYLAAHSTPQQFRALLQDQRAVAHRLPLAKLVAAFEQELATPR